MLEDARDDGEGCCAFRLTPQIDFENATRSSDLGLSSLSPAWWTPVSKGALTAVVGIFVDSDCSTWEECERGSLE